MKGINTRYIKTAFALTALLLAGVIMGGCPNIFDPPSHKRESASGGGGLRITIGGGDNARTLFPRTDFSRYVISFSDGPGSHTPITLTGGATTTPVDGLMAGNWTITVKAYMLIDANGDGTATPGIYHPLDNPLGEEFEAATNGGQTVTITGGSQTVNISISAQQTSGVKGYFSYNVQFPDDKVDTASLTITNVGGTPSYDLTTDLTTSGEGILSGGVVTAEKVVALEPGYYLVNAVLANAYHRAGRTEIVHIYSGMETTTPSGASAWTFTSADFVDYITLSGTLDLDFPAASGADEVWIELYRTQPTQENLANPSFMPFARGQVNNEENWSVPITPFAIETPVYLLIALKTGSAWSHALPNTLSVNVTNASIPGIALEAAGAASAAVSNVTISGTTGTAISPKTFTISLTNATFKAASVNNNVSTYITNLPSGLGAVVEAATTEGATTITVKVSGSTSTASSEALAVVIPVGKLNGVLSDLPAVSNADAKFAIAEPGSNKTLTITTIPSDANGLYYSIGLFSSDADPFGDNPVAYLRGHYNSSGTITGTLIQFPTSSTPWTDQGNFYIGIAFYEDDSYSDSSLEVGFISNNTVSFTNPSPNPSIVFDPGDSGTFRQVENEPEAHIYSGGIFGWQGSPVSANIEIQLERAEFTGITPDWSTGTIVSGWITNLPAGLTARAAYLYTYSDTSQLTIRIEGTPSSTVNAEITMEIPASFLVDFDTPLPVQNPDNRKIMISSTYKTLSGSISLTLNGSPMTIPSSPPASLQFYTNASMEGMSLAGASIDPGGSWTLQLPNDFTETIYAALSLPGGYYSYIRLDGISHDLSTLTWAMGTQHLVSISGTVSVTVNGAPFVPDPVPPGKYISVSAYVRDSGGNDYDWLGNVRSQSDGSWEIIMLSAAGPRNVTLEVEANTDDGTVHHRKEDVWTGQVVNSIQVTTGLLDIDFTTISGTIGTVSVNGTPVGNSYYYYYYYLGAVNSLGESIDDDIDIENNGDWTMDVGSHTGPVQFLVGAITTPGSYHVLVLAPPLASPAPEVTSAGLSGVTIGNVNIPTRNVAVTVTQGANPIPSLVAIAKEPVVLADLSDHTPYYKFVSLPYDAGIPHVQTGPITMPVHTGQSEDLYFVAVRENGDTYVTNSTVDTSSGTVSLNINTMTWIGTMDMDGD
jgi:hypothetical protein